jgi:hypothetical protein
MLSPQARKLQRDIRSVYSGRKVCEADTDGGEDKVGDINDISL